MGARGPRNTTEIWNKYSWCSYNKIGCDQPQNWLRPYVSYSSATTALVNELSTANILSINVPILKVYFWGGATRFEGSRSRQSQIGLCKGVSSPNWHPDTCQLGNPTSGPLWIVSNKDGGLFQMTRKKSNQLCNRWWEAGWPNGCQENFYSLLSFAIFLPLVIMRKLFLLTRCLRYNSWAPFWLVLEFIETQFLGHCVSFYRVQSLKTDS